MKPSPPATRIRERRSAETLPLPLPGAVTGTGLVLPAGLSRERWRQVGQTLRTIAGAVQWWVGDWLAYGQDCGYISRSRYDLAEGVTGFAAKTLRNVSYVARRVESSLRRDDLEWHHHALVAPLPAADQAAWLAKAKDNAWSVTSLRRALAEARADGAPPWLCYTDVWNFPACDDRYGLSDFPGRIPGQIVQNTLYYFAEPGALVVDPMAGGGTTLDVCKALDFRCIAFDLVPARKEILQADARDPWPLPEPADLIFIDPPYGSQQAAAYGGLAALEPPAFLEEFTRVLVAAEAALAPDGRLAILIAPMAIKTDYVDLPFEITTRAAALGLKLIRRFSVPVSLQQISPQVVAHCKRERIHVALLRDLLVFDLPVAAEAAS